MKAALYLAPELVEIRDVPLPVLSDDEVMVRVSYCGICGTDMHIFKGDGGSTDVVPPLIFGHEFSGIVADVGKDVYNHNIGDYISIDPNRYCGSCYYCNNGKPHFCKKLVATGVNEHGGFAEYCVVKASQVYKVNDDIDLLEAAMVEPLSCCIHGIDLCNISLGDDILIIGGGSIGMIMIQLAKLSGCKRVILSEPVEEKRNLGIKLGADVVIDPINEDLKSRISEISENIDVVIECVGREATIKQGIDVAGHGAIIMMYGLTGGSVSIPVMPDMFFKKELKLTSSFINPHTFERSIGILNSRKLDLTSSIYRVIDINELPNVLKDPSNMSKGKVVVRFE